MCDALEKVDATIRVNGMQCPVTNMLDIDGEELVESDTVDNVCTVVAQAPDGRWLTLAASYTDLWPLQ